MAANIVKLARDIVQRASVVLRGDKSIFAKRQALRILGTEATHWRSMPPRDQAAAFLIWAQSYLPTTPILITELRAGYVDWCFAEQISPVGEPALLHHLSELGVEKALANIRGEDGYRFRPTVYVIPPAKSPGSRKSPRARKVLAATIEQVAKAA